MGKTNLKNQRVGRQKLDRMQNIGIKGLLLSMIPLSKEQRESLFEIIEKSGDLKSLELIKTALMVIDYYEEVLTKISTSVSDFDVFLAKKQDESWDEFVATVEGKEV